MFVCVQEGEELKAFISVNWVLTDSELDLETQARALLSYLAVCFCGEVQLPSCAMAYVDCAHTVCSSAAAAISWLSALPLCCRFPHFCWRCCTATQR